MEIKIISFSAKGCSKAAEIAKGLEAMDSLYRCENFSPQRYISDDRTAALSESLDMWTAKNFACSDALIFVGAAGIAVRAIAPQVKEKTEDPAVVVVDELGRYAISLLSGHLGGANLLARAVAGVIRAEAVITTATDINERFSVDTFAKDNGLYIEDMKLAKEISAAVLRDEKIGFISDTKVRGNMPDCLIRCEDIKQRQKLNIYIGRREITFKDTLNLRPRPYVLGIGCRRGKPLEELEQAAVSAAQKAGIRMEDIGTIASIDLKQDEEGLLQLCRKYKMKSRFYTASRLMSLEGSFSPSAFVSKITGADNVCERAAVAASEGGALIDKKRSLCGVTTALALKEEDRMEVSFE